MTASEQIMAVMATRGRAKVADVLAAVDASQGAVYQALGKLAEAGELVRLGPGFYAMNIDGQPAPAAEGETEASDREAKPRSRGTKRRNGETPPPVAAAESAADEPANEVDPMELAVWHTGELTVRRADQAIVLSADEVRQTLAFLHRFGEAER